MIRHPQAKHFIFVLNRVFIAFLLSIASHKAEAASAEPQERARKLVFNSRDISPTIVFIGANSWKINRNWHDVRPTSTNKLLIYNSQHNSGTEWTSVDDWPAGMYIPSRYRLRLTWSNWKKGAPGEIHGLKVENYSRTIPGAVLTEELSVSKEIKAPSSLLKFMNAFFGCDTSLGFPLRDTILTPPGPSSRATGWLVLQEASWQNVPTIKIPDHVKVTKDWYDVVTGGAKDVDVLYRSDPGYKKGRE